MTEQEILDDYSELEPDGFRAVYDFAAKTGRRLALWGCGLTRTSRANWLSGLPSC